MKRSVPISFYSDLWWCRGFNKDDLFTPPFVHCRHFRHTSADMHTRLLPWLPEHIKRPGIKSGAFVRTGGGGEGWTWQLAGPLRCVLADGVGVLSVGLWVDSQTPTQRYQGCE